MKHKLVLAIKNLLQNTGPKDIWTISSVLKQALLIFDYTFIIIANGTIDASEVDHFLKDLSKESGQEVISKYSLSQKVSMFVDI